MWQKAGSCVAKCNKNFCQRSGKKYGQGQDQNTALVPNEICKVHLHKYEQSPLHKYEQNLFTEYPMQKGQQGQIHIGQVINKIEKER